MNNGQNMYFYLKKNNRTIKVYLRLSSNNDKTKTISLPIKIQNVEQWDKSKQLLSDKAGRLDQYKLYNLYLNKIKSTIIYFFDGGYDNQIENICKLIKLINPINRFDYDIEDEIFTYTYYRDYRTPNYQDKKEQLKLIKFHSPEYCLNRYYIDDWLPLNYIFLIKKKVSFEKFNTIDIYLKIMYGSNKTQLKLFNDVSNEHWDMTINRFTYTHLGIKEENIYLSNIQNYLSILPHYIDKNKLSIDILSVKENIKKGNQHIFDEIMIMIKNIKGN